MNLSRQEINLRRLLAKCELIIKSKKEDDRIEKYIETTEDMLQEVKKVIDSHEKIADYKKRIHNIKVSAGIKVAKYIDEDPEISRNNLLGLRHRILESKLSNADDLDEVLNYHENRQKNITQDMLSLTQTLKEQSEIANRIIKKDTEVVSQSSVLSDQNLVKLSTESTKLAEHSKRAWKCWMWIMLAVVVIAFIIFEKRRKNPKNL